MDEILKFILYTPFGEFTTAFKDSATKRHSTLLHKLLLRLCYTMRTEEMYMRCEANV